MADVVQLELKALRNGVGCLEPDVTAAAYLAAKAALGEVGHGPATHCEVLDQGEHKFVVLLKCDTIGAQGEIRSWRNRQRLAEWAAEGVAFMMIERFTPYTVVEQADTSDAPGIDYYLGLKDLVDCDDHDEFPVHSARLEVSGILRQSRGNSLHRRVREKIEQSKQSDADGTPAIIVVIAFDAPLANLTVRSP